MSDNEVIDFNVMQVSELLSILERHDVFVGDIASDLEASEMLSELMVVACRMLDKEQAAILFASI